jgi:hypothetical protein
MFALAPFIDGVNELVLDMGDAGAEAQLALSIHPALCGLPQRRISDIQMGLEPKHALPWERSVARGRHLLCKHRRGGPLQFERRC